MKHQSKILLIGLIITLLIPVMASAAQTPMDNTSNSSLYSPDSVENYEYQGKIIYPVPINNLDFKSVTASNIQFNLSTEQFL